MQNINDLMQFKSTLPIYKKISLTPENSIYNKPNNTYGIFKENGGDCLGVVGKNFFPVDLPLLFDNLFASLPTELLNLNNINFKEYKNNKVISFEIQSNDFKIENSPVKDDIFKTKILFMTGLDGSTKLNLNFYTLRLICSNGAKGWQNDLSLKLKNTIFNHAKLNLFTSEVAQTLNNVKKYSLQLSTLTQKKIDESQLNSFYFELLGYDYTEYSKLHNRQRGILDEINSAIRLEEIDLGLSEYTLLQGVSRYVTHHRSLPDKAENFLFGSGLILNNKAHKILLS